ncbi:C45 family autoproteolytic acyltransferase/hydolase [Salinarimonas ramus]|uniref:Peptidase C45 n=1 Tax=Salinarimonas ramus TaxID=690164 RepID=A0A917QI18_9HYPH|nr:C45 family autoproteolytic acyltransferase/hydolase [Salinarimonas ramus]GGK50025.1 peptidase C45 [Salinarimonas ramus]
MQLVAISEERPGNRWLARFEALWPGYRAWMGDAAFDPPLATRRAALARHMPELVALHDHLCGLLGDDPAAHAFLTGWAPPPVITGCSVAISPEEEPVMIRNYDFTSDFYEGTLHHGRWSGGPSVIASSEALIGALDGMNDAGLAAALTYGGRPVHGEGFGNPWLVRYVLETCATVKEALAALTRIPSVMATNIVVLDRGGAHAVAMLAPDREPVVLDRPVVTNHQVAPEHPAGDAQSETVLRCDVLTRLREARGTTRADLLAAFLRPPVLRSDYAGVMGTFYTAVYRPAAGAVDYVWPDRPAWAQSFARFEEGAREIPG